MLWVFFFFFSSRRRHTRFDCDWSSDVCSSDLSGKIRAYAVTSRTRLAAAPDIPTVDEVGLPGFYISVWRGLFAPKGTPKEVIAKLNAAVADALSDETVRQRLADLGQDVPSRDEQTPDALGAL